MPKHNVYTIYSIYIKEERRNSFRKEEIMPFLATSFQPEMSEVIDQCDLETLVDTVNKNLPEPPQMYPKIIREFAEDYEHEEVFG